MDISQVVANNVGAVTTVGIFIWYLIKKDKLTEEVFSKLTGRLDQLAHVIGSLEDRLHSIEISRTVELTKGDPGQHKETVTVKT